MRNYPVKKGFKTDTGTISAKIEKYTREMNVNGNTIVFSLPGIPKILIECGRKTLDVETETDTSYSDPMSSLKTYNNLITELTGYDSKERKKRMSKID
ncbi:DUF5611 family protein [Cuniculiplasma sp. SKW3]|uniref:DUF5611 family protein n=1 Tax=Cuniculiplasma sp. SKW3 TaxID=3400170 RepID=UPI003FD1F5F8